MTAEVVGAGGSHVPAPTADRPRRGSALRRTLGPALLVSAGYVDPGNWGADVASGALFGYSLIWVLAAAMVAALFLQQLAARVGLSSGHDLATLIQTRLPRTARRVVVPPVLLALAVTEIVEVLGIVLGLQLLTGCSAAVAAAGGAALVLGILCLPGRAGRRIVYLCLGLIAVVYVVALCLQGAGAVVVHIRPGALPTGGVPVAVALVGSVVMPHNILLHSSLARDLRGTSAPSRAGLRTLLRGSVVTGAVALGLAFVVNASITSVAAGTTDDSQDVGALTAGLEPLFGQVASVLFACTLLASGLASSTTGGMVSVDVLARFAPALAIPVTLRRLVFLVPAAAVASSPLPQVSVLVWSQVVMTCALPLVLVPLVWLARRSDVMGDGRIGRPTLVLAVTVTVVLALAGLASFMA